MNAQIIIEKAEQNLQKRFSEIDETALYNQEKILNAFLKNNISERHFAGTTGYGYGDIGREALCKVFADAFSAQSAVVSPNILSGTHAITLMLFGVLRPNDTVLSITGKPYDTLCDVFSGQNTGSLHDFGINFEQIDLILDENSVPFFDFEKIEIYLKEKGAKAVFIQRSRGYNPRHGLSCEKIKTACEFIKKISPKTVVLVDNCYCEFVETVEPTELGADVVSGSLIKNAGGGLAPTGGYIAGRGDLIEQIAYRLTSPSVGNEIGSYAYGYRPFFQGLFMAPSTVKHALKSSALFASVFQSLGYKTMPSGDFAPYDIVTSIEFNTENELLNFCRAVQHASPVDGHVTLEPWDMPGYAHKVIMAAGTFVQGASIELSADSPIKKPYIAYIQGALTYEHAKIALKSALNRLFETKN
jgi:cystathionine beta-lyase family protein involved in aluminum resistance